MSSELRRSLEQAQNRVEAIRENAARQAIVKVTHVTTGPGETALAKPVLFPVVFLEQPSVATGATVSGKLIKDDFPQIDAFLWGKAWARDEKGNYIGFYPAFRIASVGSYKVTHCFTFTGVAMKITGGF